jgi:hypothetical protein
MLDFALGDKVLDCARHVLYRHLGIDAMLIEQVDHLDAQPLQRSVADLADVLGPAIHGGLLARLGINREAELGGVCAGVAPDLDNPVSFRKALSKWLELA